jgi:predicted Zn-dependent peptidase
MRLTTLAFVPVALATVGPALGAQGPGPDRSRPPALGPLPALRLPAIQRFELANGLKVLFMEKHGVPLVQVNVLVKAGAAMDDGGRFGLASMTAAMMDEGAGSRDALALADAVEYLGARLSTGAGMHTSVIQLHTPLAKLDSALALLADVTLRPTFPDAELERQRKERVTALTQWRDEPRAIASVLFNRTLFGSTHPYGIPPQGTIPALTALEVAGLRAFHAAWYRPANATLVVVGDVAPGAIRARLEATFGRWGPGPTPPLTWPAPRHVAVREVYLVDKPGAAQSEIRIGRIGVERKTEDYFPLVVMNTVLGGGIGRGADRGDRQGAGRVHEGDPEHRNGHGRRADPGEELRGAGIPPGLPVGGVHREPVAGPRAVRPARRLLRPLHPERNAGDARRRGARGPEVH